jgi:hypothetical protein
MSPRQGLLRLDGHTIEVDALWQLGHKVQRRTAVDASGPRSCLARWPFHPMPAVMSTHCPAQAKAGPGLMFMLALHSVLLRGWREQASEGCLCRREKICRGEQKWLREFAGARDPEGGAACIQPARPRGSEAAKLPGSRTARRPAGWARMRTAYRQARLARGLAAIQPAGRLLSKLHTGSSRTRLPCVLVEGLLKIRMMSPDVLPRGWSSGVCCKPGSLGSIQQASRRAGQT